MNKLERVVATFNCEETDRPPIYDLIRNDAGIEHFAGERINIDNPAPAVYKAYSSYADATKSGIKLPEVEGKSITINGEEYVTQRWTAWKVKETGYDLESLKSSVVDKIRTLKQSSDSLAQSMQCYIDDYYEKQQKVGDTVIFPNSPGTGGGVYSSYLFCGGLDKFSYFLCDCPELAEELVDSAFQHTMGFIRAMPSGFAPPVVVIPEDIGGNSGPLFSPAYLRSALFPRLKEVVRAYHDRGIKVILHSDGNLNSVMDDIVATGVDGIHPVETIAGMNVGDLRSRYPKLVLIGGVDCSQLLPFGKPEEVYRTVKDNIRQAGYGYFPGSSSEINNEVPLENILALYNAVHDAM